jgi:hypothetical protein
LTDVNVVVVDCQAATITKWKWTRLVSAVGAIFDPKTWIDAASLGPGSRPLLRLRSETEMDAVKLAVGALFDPKT